MDILGLCLSTRDLARVTLVGHLVRRRRLRTPQPRVASQADIAADLFQHDLERDTIDAVRHDRLHDGVGQHLLEGRFAMIPDHDFSSPIVLWIGRCISMIRSRPAYSAATRKGTTRSSSSMCAGCSMKAFTVSSLRTRNQ